jgi:hypothetical protein
MYNFVFAVENYYKMHEEKNILNFHVLALVMKILARKYVLVNRIKFSQSLPNKSMYFEKESIFL